MKTRKILDLIYKKAWDRATPNNLVEQAEAEVVPSSSLVEVEVEVKVEVGVGVWAKMQFSFLTFSGG